MDRNSTEPQRAYPDALRVKHILEQMFQGYTGCLGVRFWNGETITLGRGSPAGPKKANQSMMDS